MPRTARPSWLFKNLLTILGSTGDIRSMLYDKGFFPPPDDTIQGWRNRNSIPGKWVPVLIQLGIERGFLRDINDLKPRERTRGRSPTNSN
jgi:hypothetical protein